MATGQLEPRTRRFPCAEALHDRTGGTAASAGVPVAEPGDNVLHISLEGSALIHNLVVLVGPGIERRPKPPEVNWPRSPPPAATPVRAAECHLRSLVEQEELAEVRIQAGQCHGEAGAVRL